MKFSPIEGTFLRRLNRFAGEALVKGKRVMIHIHDPGRLKELLLPKARILLIPGHGKLKYQLLAVWREGYGWVFLHSGYHSLVVEELLHKKWLPEFQVLGYAREVKVDHHRIDFFLVDSLGVFPLEIKGCTLFEGERALFPDAPTRRGREHVDILSKFERAMLLFLVMNQKPTHIVPNEKTDHKFTQTIVDAVKDHLHVTAINFRFDGKELKPTKRIPFLYKPNIAMNALEKVVKVFNQRFSPEATAVLTLIVEDVAKVLFYGHICVSCSLHDYFEDLSIIGDELGISLQPKSYQRFGDAFVVKYLL